MKDTHPCRNCGTELPVPWHLWWLRSFLTCPSAGRCEWIASLVDSEPPEPIDYEPEPDDAWVCSLCQGPGEYIARQDWQGGIELATCPNCEGSGVQPGYRQPVA